MKARPFPRLRKIVSLTGFFCLVSVVLFNVGAEGVQTDVPGLKDVFAGDFRIGCLLSYEYVGLPDDPPVPGQSEVRTPAGGLLVKHHMNSMTPGNYLKPFFVLNINASQKAVKTAAPDQKLYAETHPVVRFGGDLIAQLNWAKRNGFTFRGHTLVWHAQTPTQFFREGYQYAGAWVTKEVMLQRLEFHISEVIRLLHEGWPGLVSAMDVVNEAIDDTGRLRGADKNDWYSVFGDDTYVMKAFEYARKYARQYGETQMKLYYNDYNTSSPVKADGIVKLCAPIFKAGSLDGIGLQEHDGLTSPSAAAWIISYDKFQAVCHEMAITELDVSSGFADPEPAVLQAQANQYAALFKLFLERSQGSGRGKIVNVSKDGLNDQYTMKANQASSLWDTNLQCKPAFFAVVDMAKNYKELAALIASVKKAGRQGRSAAAWAAVTKALPAAKEALAKNYSASESAVSGMGDALANLKQALAAK